MRVYVYVCVRVSMCVRVFVRVRVCHTHAQTHTLLGEQFSSCSLVKGLLLNKISRDTHPWVSSLVKGLLFNKISRDTHRVEPDVDVVGETVL